MPRAKKQHLNLKVVRSNRIGRTSATPRKQKVSGDLLSETINIKVMLYRISLTFVMGEEKKEALHTEILKAIGAEPDEVKVIEILIVWKPNKAQGQPKQDERIWGDLPPPLVPLISCIDVIEPSRGTDYDVYSTKQSARA